MSTGVLSLVTLYNHDGVGLGTLSAGAAETFIDTVSLPVTGTYTILVDPVTTNTGTLTLTLYDVVDVSGSATADGSSQTVTTSTPGQNARLTFSGTSGQRVSLKVGAGPGGTVSILSPDRSTLASLSINPALASFIDTQTLAMAGTYTVVVDYSTKQTGSVTLNLYTVPADVTSTITAGGSGVTLTTTTPGQNGSVTFTGTSGHRMSILISSVTAGNVTVSLRDPSGATLSSLTVGSLGGFIEPQTLTSSGTHTIVADPTGTNTGSVTLTLYDTPADVTGTLTVNGGGTAVTLSTAGQNASYTFSGTASQLLTVRITSNTIKTPANVAGLVTVKLLRQNGTVLTTTISSAASFNLTQQTLPATETYTVLIDPAGANTGGLTVSVTNP